MGLRLAVWAASCRIPRTQGEPCLVMWPWRRLRSELRTWGVSPAQAHSLRAEGNRAMSPISATKVMAVSRPTPGRTMSAWTRGSGLASPAISRSSRPIGVARASSSPQQSWMIPRGVAGSSRSASQARPGPVHRLEWSGMPRSASTACTRFLQAVPMRTRLARWRSKARRSRTCWGAIQASGSRSARSSWARVAASTLSFFNLAEAMALGAAGMDQVRLQLQLLQQLHQPAPAVGRLERDRSAWRQRAKDRDQLGRIVGELAVVLLDAGVIQHRDLGTLAVDVHPDVDPHQGLLPRARQSPKPRLSG